jgi:hypothetical protein
VTLDVSDSSEIYLFDDINVVPHDRVELDKNPTKTAEVTVIIENPDNSDGYTILSNITYTAPKVTPSSTPVIWQLILPCTVTTLIPSCSRKVM